jgi:hypothetical protein
MADDRETPAGPASLATRSLPMSDDSTTKPPASTKAAAWVTGILGISAAVAVIYGCSLAVRGLDTERMESPLILSIARQLLRGPRELYGPFGWSNPLVIIHAPLYYRLAALFAWPMFKSGLDPVPAALAAGRSLSFLGLGWTIAMAYRLARFDGRRARVGLWAGLLIAASPAISVSPYTVRPDMLGVAFQTTGVFLVLHALRSDRPRRIYVVSAFATFGLALCVKQQFIMAPAISSVLVTTACLRGRISSKAVALAILTGAAIMLAVYGTEEVVTRAEMSQSVFRAALAVSQVHPADTIRALLILYGIFARSSGMIALLLAASLVSAAYGRGIVRTGIVILGGGTLGLIALEGIFSALRIRIGDYDHLLTLAYLAVAIVVVIPACYLMAHRVLIAERLDRVLWIYLAAELGFVVVLSRMSTGAWINYGVQAVVFASVLIARALDRAIEHIRSRRQVFPIAAAALVSLIGVGDEIGTSTERRRVEKAAIEHIFDELGHPPSQRFFFVALPGLNRVYGRLDLVYDGWLYPVFEYLHLAEPRSSWLRRALRSESVGFVITATDSPIIEGIPEPINRLGYAPDIKVGPYFVWKHYRFMEARQAR